MATKLIFPYCYSKFRQEFFARQRDWLAARDIDLVLFDDDIGPQDFALFHESIVAPHFEESVARTVDVLDRYVRERGADGIVAHSEASLLATALIAARHGFTAVSPAAALACTSKYQTRRLLERARVPIPRFTLAHAPNEVKRFARTQVGYPVMLKAVVSTMARNVVKVASESEVEAAVARVQRGIAVSPDVRRCVEFAALAELDLGCDPLQQFLVEEYVEGEPVETDGIVCGSHLVTFGITDQVLTPPPHIYMDGYLFPADRAGEHVARIQKVSDDALRAIGLENGAFSMELRYDGSTPRVIEINGRLGEEDVMGEMVHAALGMYPMLGLIEIAAGSSRPPVLRRAQPCAITFLNYLKDGVVRATPTAAQLDQWRAAGARVEIQAPVGSRMYAPGHHETFPHLAYVLCTDEHSSRAAYQRGRHIADQLQFEIDAP